MIRVAHFSDLHYGGKTLAEADRCFGAGIDRAIEPGVDAAVISGDATDHALDLHAPAARLLAEQVRRLVPAGIEQAVAQAAGFSNEKSFSRAFRQWSGLAPAVFRRQAQTPPAPGPQ